MWIKVLGNFYWVYFFNWNLGDWEKSKLKMGRRMEVSSRMDLPSSIIKMLLYKVNYLDISDLHFYRKYY